MVVSEFSKLTILVVDDDEYMLELVSATLKSMDVSNVICFDTGEKALRFIDEESVIDLVLCDLQMPEMDGVEVLRNLALRKFSGGIILFSGEDERILKIAENLANAHSLNILGSVVKPITAESMKALLSKYNIVEEDNNGENCSIFSLEELQVGLDADQFEMYFQPKINIRSKKVDSVEALVRWRHPQRGIVPPILFIPLMENCELINVLTRIVLVKSLKYAGVWKQRGYQIKVAVNLSIDNLSNINFPDFLISEINANGLSATDIILEITESKIIENLTLTLDTLTRLCLKGFGLSIDDFGTGYSSMKQLMQIPFSELKIDRQFVHNAVNNAAARAILESSIELARKLNLSIVAEGVENQSDWDLVDELGCDMVQGYFIAKPMPVEDFKKWIENWQSTNAS